MFASLLIHHFLLDSIFSSADSRQAELMLWSFVRPSSWTILHFQLFLQNRHSECVDITWECPLGQASLIFTTRWRCDLACPKSRPKSVYFYQITKKSSSATFPNGIIYRCIFRFSWPLFRVLHSRNFEFRIFGSPGRTLAFFWKFTKKSTPPTFLIGIISPCIFRFSQALHTALHSWNFEFWLFGYSGLAGTLSKNRQIS